MAKCDRGWVVVVALELVASGEFGRGECEFAVGFDSVVCKKGERKGGYSDKASQDG